MKLKRPLIEGRSSGRDVRDFVKRTLHRLSYYGLGENFFPKPKGGFDPVYNKKTADAIEVLRRFEDRRPFVGPFRQDDLDSLWDKADRYARWVYRVWSAPKPPPKLVEPNQGFHSLSRSLWTAYSLCRNSGSQFIDLGTYNPASNLPSGAPSDHSVYPACAFDIGIEPDTGWNNLKARALVIKLVRLPEVRYVILGNRIWTDWRKVWGAYHSGGHMNHIHVSGYR